MGDRADASGVSGNAAPSSAPRAAPIPPQHLAPAQRLAAAATQCLLAGGSLVAQLYDDLRATFGPHGPVHLCSIVGQYLFLSATLNTFDVPVPA